MSVFGPSDWSSEETHYILENLFLMRRKRRNSTPNMVAATAKEARNEFNETPAFSWALPAVELTALPTSEMDDGLGTVLIVGDVWQSRRLAC